MSVELINRVDRGPGLRDGVEGNDECHVRMLDKTGFRVEQGDHKGY